MMKYLLTLLLFACSLGASSQTVPLTQKKELFDKHLTVMLPFDFKQMTATEVAERYDATNPPNYVFRGPESSINLAFSNSYQTNPVDTTAMLELVNILKGSLEKSYPALFWVDHSSSSVNGKLVGKLEFKSLTPANEMVYNMMYLIGVNGQLVIVNFNCECAANDPWAKTGRQILAGIVVR
ncbi:hypothetical protein BH09BAC1_BH09BAC1_06040 [soil metagenome]